MGELPILEQQDRDRLLAAVQAWALEHPSPSRPLIGFAGSTMLSPLQLSVALERRNPDGVAFEILVRNGMTRVPLDRIIAQLRGELAQ